MNDHLNMLPKQTKFDLKCSRMRWQLGIPQTPLGSLRRSPKPPNIYRDGKLLPS